MAENILKERLKRNGRQDIVVSSAALIDIEGQPADPVAVKILMENRIESGDHFSRLLTAGMVADADLIAVMEENHKIRLACLMRDFQAILTNIIFGRLHGAILKLRRAFCEHAHAAGALYQISKIAGAG